MKYILTTFLVKSIEGSESFDLARKLFVLIFFKKRCNNADTKQCTDNNHV